MRSIMITSIWFLSLCEPIVQGREQPPVPWYCSSWLQNALKSFDVRCVATSHQLWSNWIQVLVCWCAEGGLKGESSNFSSQGLDESFRVFLHNMNIVSLLPLQSYHGEDIVFAHRNVHGRFDVIDRHLVQVVFDFLMFNYRSIMSHANYYKLPYLILRFMLPWQSCNYSNYIDFIRSIHHNSNRLLT